ncbi:hypothetical protein JAAARDRAFT_182862 [Jaapia argillacea MUCL 33604]|uniref:tRNA ligase n=1 Tax=Jaapia argillacea MUCL 33604 TaxID=933084 RepID=A0A067PTR5_9AGAM|nr:hypothetical protein JAAARDRAFT_182862 [Jaapia argillacea MUCL 33604]
MAPNFSEEDSQLIADLHRISSKAPKLIKSSEYAAPADPEITLRSWKMNEFKYYDIPSPFPTLARGLFTRELENGKYRIVVRGYDKFFNIGEVPWTTWESLEAHTAPPYTLTMKSNGCIIFIAALTSTKLVITSKHSLGQVGNSPQSHAQRGEWWLQQQFEKLGKTEADLAGVLWEENWTAIAELCDDGFEEHVLAYPPDKTGLHLHGLNACSKHFRTMPPDQVNAFAREWGFIETPSTELKSIPEVKKFTEEVAETGSWGGEAIEGFVVRTHVTEPPTKGNTNNVSASPYEPGSSFFFKVKFDEPYMMYRDWRELTKQVLSGKGVGQLSKHRMKRLETKLYVKWVVEEIKRDRAQFDGYTNGHGIIATRERFLEWMKTKKGIEVSAAVEAAGDLNDPVQVDGEKQFGKTIIVPVAVPGVGKTTLAVALVHLFGFGHTQSDDVHAKKPGPAFVKNVVKLLDNHDVVIADKNNHLRLHRQALRDAIEKISPPVRLLALSWTFDIPPAMVHRICGDRVLARGDKHQTLRADTLAKTHEEVIWKFLSEAEELSDDEVDVSVEMNIEDNFEQALKRVIGVCVKVLGVERPSEEKIQEALDAAAGYEPKTKKNEKQTEKAALPRYFGLLPEVDLEDVLSKAMGPTNVPKEGQDFFKGIKAENRVAKRPHVTIAHFNNHREEVDLWERCMGIHKLPTGPLFKAKLGHVVWNDRVMAVTVEDLAVDSEGDAKGQEAQEFISKLPHEVRDRLHITVGTKNKDIKPVEAKELVEKWRKGEKVGSVELEGLEVKGRLKGLFS